MTASGGDAGVRKFQLPQVKELDGPADPDRRSTEEQLESTLRRRAARMSRDRPPTPD